MKPIVRIENAAYRKIMHWVNKSNNEVSGLGTIVRVNDMFIIKDAILLDQDVSSTTTKIGAEAVAKALYETARQDGTLNFWWHSHVNMAVFWSGTDDSTIKEMGMGGWCISSVFNKRNEMKTRFRSTDYHFPIDLDDVPLEIIREAEVVPPEWDKEFEEKVKTFTPPVYRPYQGRHWMDRTQGSATSTTHTGTNSMGTGAASRPEGMTKREWKKWRRSQFDYKPLVEVKNEVSAYPFTQQELKQLAEEGIDLPCLDWHIESGKSRNEILYFYNLDIVNGWVIDTAGYNGGWAYAE
jgi:hypothetical protein